MASVDIVMSLSTVVMLEPIGIIGMLRLETSNARHKSPDESFGEKYGIA
jgi:hypothetical protein